MPLILRSYIYQMIPFKGNAQFIFLCNTQKPSVDFFLMKNIKKHCHKKRNCVFYNLSEENF